MLCALLAGTLTGCKSFSRPQPQGPPAGPVPAPQVLDPELRPGALLDQADSFYEASDYQAAAQAYSLVLERGAGGDTDRVLFRLAMIHLLPGSPVADPDAARDYLGRLLEGYPDSPFAEPARLVLDLQDRVDTLDARSTEQAHKIDQLTEQLEALKRIDLERTKPPPRR